MKKIKDIKKIKIRKIDPEVVRQKGLFGGGCLETGCDDICCEYGCDVDYGTLKLIYRYRHLIEPLIGASVDDCFSTELTPDDDYIGGAYRETLVREEDERCAFHLKDGRGCSLFYLWQTKGLPKRIVPTICRIYPITWHRGHLFVDRPIKRACRCLERVPKGVYIPSIYETQRRDILALFDIEPKELEKIERLRKERIKKFKERLKAIRK
ncbi:MAG TPA: hypothetical protein ENK42_00540 [Deltaproteobacteria bacterium]|nr:hypothetical protein [Deltaproteobacteria bacterium]